MRPGAVRDRLVAFLGDWLGRLEATVARRQAEGAIDAAEDPAQLAFEIEAALFLANAQYVVSTAPSRSSARGARSLDASPAWPRRARRAPEARATVLRRPRAGFPSRTRPRRGSGRRRDVIGRPHAPKRCGARRTRERAGVALGLGQHGARRDAAHPDRRCPRLREHLGQVHQPRLRDRVRRERRPCLQRGHVGDEHDHAARSQASRRARPAPRRSLHAGSSRLPRRRAPAHVLRARCAEAPCCRVDEHVEPAERLRRLRDRPPIAGDRVHVAGERDETRPSARIAAAVSSPRLRPLREVTATSAPCSARPSAMARPSLRPPPITSARDPSTRGMAGMLPGSAAVNAAMLAGPVRDDVAQPDLHGASAARCPP